MERLEWRTVIVWGKKSDRSRFWTRFETYGEAGYGFWWKTVYLDGAWRLEAYQYGNHEAIWFSDGDDDLGTSSALELLAAMVVMVSEHTEVSGYTSPHQVNNYGDQSGPEYQEQAVRLRKRWRLWMQDAPDWAISAASQAESTISL